VGLRKQGNGGGTLNKCLESLGNRDCGLPVIGCRGASERKKEGEPAEGSVANAWRLLGKNIKRPCEEEIVWKERKGLGGGG